MLVELICPQCGGKMQVDDSRERAFCTYCGAELANLTQKIDITQTVNVSGTVLTKTDRSNEPNLIIDFSCEEPNGRMIITFNNTKIKRVINNGQTASLRLPLGHCVAEMDLAGRSYKRDLWIVEEAPVRINASAFGRREIVIEQPPYHIPEEERLKNEADEQAKAEAALKAKNEANTTRPSGLSIAAFVLSLTFYASIVGLILGIISLVKDKKRKRVFAMLGTIIGGVMTLFFMIYIIIGVIYGFATFMAELEQGTIEAISLF